MGFLRRLLGASGDDRPEEDRPAKDRPAKREPETGPGPGRLETDAGGDPRLGDDPTRARELTRAFDAGLDDLARRQLRFEDLAWRPPSQLRREGDWILMARWEARREDGRAVTIKSGERLTYVGEGTAWPWARRFATRKGELVDLPPGRAEDGWPEDLQRPRSPTAGSEDG